MNQDADQLQLLGVFHYVVGALIAFASCIPIVHLAIGLVIILNPNIIAAPEPERPLIVGWLFVGMALMFILGGWAVAVLVAWAGRCLQRRKHYTFCLIMAGVVCLFMPLGTALGIFAFIVLLRPSVKAVFGQPVAAT